MTFKVPFGSPSETASSLRMRITEETSAKAFEKAEADADHLFAQYPLAPDNLSLLTALAGSYESAGRYDKSIQMLDKIIQFYPGGWIAFNQRCWVKATRNIASDTALADCDHGLKLTPNNAKLLDSRGFARLKAKDNQGALADYNAAFALQPNKPTTLYGRGLAKLRLGDRSGNADIAAARKLDEKIGDTFALYGVSA